MQRDKIWKQKTAVVQHRNPSLPKPNDSWKISLTLVTLDAFEWGNGESGIEETALKANNIATNHILHDAHLHSFMNQEITNEKQTSIGFSLMPLSDLPIRVG